MMKKKKDLTAAVEKRTNLAEAITEIKQKFGEGAIIKMKDVRPVNIGAISTGSISLDMALGVNGIPRGRVVEVFGPESSGKSTLALHVCAEAQKNGGVAAFVDAEHALDPDYARKIGVDMDELLISQPDSGEQALQIVEALVRSGEVDVIVIDSVAALAPKAEIAGEIGDFQIGLQARLMSSALRKLSAVIAQTKTAVLFLNQTRMKIGQLYDIEELRGLGGIVDYVVGTPLTKVYCLAEHADPKQRHYLSLYKMGDGPLFPFFVPYHLVHFEVPNAIARVVLFRDSVAKPLGGPVVEVCAVAKRDLKTGEVLDDYGMYMTYGEAVNADEMSKNRYLPEGLVEGCKLTRDIRKDEVITYDQVELPPDRLADCLRAEQYRHFRGETWLEQRINLRS